MKRFDLIKLSIIVIGGFLTGMGVVTLILYAVGQPQTTAITGVVPMASPTALGFVLIGVAIILLSVRTLTKATYRQITQSDIWITK